MFIPKVIRKMCSKLRGGDCAFWWPCLCCTREAGPGWGEEGLWVNPGSSELRAREESKVSSQPIPFCFHLECMLSLSILHQRDTSVSRHLATKVGTPFPAPASQLIVHRWELQPQWSVCVCVFLVLMLDFGVDFGMLLGASMSSVWREPVQCLHKCVRSMGPVRPRVLELLCSGWLSPIPTSKPAL